MTEPARNLRRLAKLRRAVDAEDRRLLGVLNARLRLVERIARVKRDLGMPVYAPDREERLLRALAQGNAGPLTDSGLRAIYRELLSASRAPEAPVRVAFFGPEGSFTHLAARTRFGAQESYISVPTIPDVFYEVERGKTNYGVVPVENSTEGVINHTLDMFMESDIKICAEVQVPIEIMLMTREKSLAGVKVVYSHPQPLAQCRHWLDERLPGASRVEMRSTPEAAKRASGQRGAAVIGPALLAHLHGLRILARNLEDLAGNTTRFFVLARAWSARTGHDKTSIMFAAKDRVGVLYDMLQPFRRHRINLTSIESRPSRKRAWEYCFFADLDGHVEDRNVASALRGLEAHCTVVKLLGSYPAAAQPAR